MKLPIAKLAPTAVVLAVAGYCTWSGMESSAEPAPAPAPAAPAAGRPEIAADLLSPRVGPSPARNPFVDPAAERERLVAEAAARAKPLPMIEAFARGAIGSPWDLRANRPTRRAGDRPVGGLAGVGRPGRGSASGLVLNATYLGGRRSTAMINGRFYSPGDALASAEGCVVKEVRAHEVLLDNNGERITLRYPGLGPAHAGAPDRRPSAAGLRVASAGADRP